MADQIEIAARADLPALPMCDGRSAALLDAYATIERTIHLGSAKAVGISELINRRLLAPTPPKPLEMTTSPSL